MIMQKILNNISSYNANKSSNTIIAQQWYSPEKKFDFI